MLSGLLAYWMDDGWIVMLGIFFVVFGSVGFMMMDFSFCFYGLVGEYLRVWCSQLGVCLSSSYSLFLFTRG